MLFNKKNGNLQHLVLLIQPLSDTDCNAYIFIQKPFARRLLSKLAANYLQFLQL